MEIRIEVCGEEHPMVEGSYNNIAGIYSKQEAYEDALNYLEKSLKILRKVYGDRHYRICAVCKNMAAIYLKLGDDE